MEVERTGASFLCRDKIGNAFVFGHGSRGRLSLFFGCVANLQLIKEFSISKEFQRYSRS